MEQETITAAHRQLVDDLLVRLLSPQMLANYALTVGVCLALGLLSAHYLRQQPDFEHKDEMMWGAHWFWAVVLAAEAILLGGLYFALTCTLYTTTVVFSATVLTPLFLWLFLHRFHWQCNSAS